MLTIHLLGRPRVELDGAPARAPRGHKAWAVLAYLLLAQRPATRTHLARTLFGDANDPLGALRWTLSELRRSLGVRISGDPMTLGVDASTEIDVCRIETADTAALLELSGELLEGIGLDAHPEFESWLGVARHRVATAIESRRRQVAVALLASGRGSEAVVYAERMVADNPFVEDNHELLVRALAMAGDRAAAARQARVCEDLFRRELGIAPSPALRAGAVFAGV